MANKITGAKCGWATSVASAEPRVRPHRSVSSLAALLAMRFILLAPLLSLITGCIYPHTTQRSPEVFGRVLDARNGTPIKSAKVFLTGHPAVSCATDRTGRFRLKATDNFHIA